jgi:hypothetical protein
MPPPIIRDISSIAAIIFAYARHRLLPMPPALQQFIVVFRDISFLRHFSFSSSFHYYFTPLRLIIFGRRRCADAAVIACAPCRRADEA